MGLESVPTCTGARGRPEHISSLSLGLTHRQTEKNTFAPKGDLGFHFTYLWNKTGATRNKQRHSWLSKKIFFLIQQLHFVLFLNYITKQMSD